MRWTIITALALAAGCATQQKTASKEREAPPPVAEAEVKTDERVEGRLTRISSESLELEGYDGAVTTMRMDDRVPVFLADESEGARTLEPGEDVRVYYRVDADGQGTAVAIEVLDSDEARELEQGHSPEEMLPHEEPFPNE